MNAKLSNFTVTLVFARRPPAVSPKIPSKARIANHQFKPQIPVGNLKKVLAARGENKRRNKEVHRLAGQQVYLCLLVSNADWHTVDKKSRYLLEWNSSESTQI